MSYNIHGVVEYQDPHVPSIVWDLGNVFFPSTWSDIQEVLGCHPDVAEGIVPKRGHPKGNTSSGYNQEFTALVIRGEALDNDTEFDKYGQCRQIDGLVLNEAGAEHWLSVGGEWLDEWHAGYRRISDPDMHEVNWITYKEYKAAIEATQTRSPNADLSVHRAVLASMKSLKKSGYKGVRFVYGIS